MHGYSSCVAIYRKANQASSLTRALIRLKISEQEKNDVMMRKNERSSTTPATKTLAKPVFVGSQPKNEGSLINICQVIFINLFGLVWRTKLLTALHAQECDTMPADGCAVAGSKNEKV
jgi:hypothetical protein